ncbi:Uncharacterized protein APZ42_009385 [Daphnia magna]|uniref:Uncharacterized protein n=1 Tax=Daphnia magna TaxID=35525 RepID=A0A164E1M7_9CRUS|nr:Uncharacterized protein APZ42_009385 [Daphnia magna]
MAGTGTDCDGGTDAIGNQTLRSATAVLDFKLRTGRAGDRLGSGHEDTL